MIFPLFILFLSICIIILILQKRTKIFTKQTNENFTQFKNHFTIHPLSKEKAIIQLKKMKDSDYVKGFSEFDIMSKTNSYTYSKDKYIQYSINQIIDWTTEEKKQLNEFYTQFLNRISELSLQKMLQLPKKINIIKSTMKHEGGAQGYTFLNNIVLKQLNYSLFAHEIFHIFTRYNPNITKLIYQTMNFKVADQLIKPNNSQFTKRIISNPDTPQIVYTTIKYNDENLYVSPILHSKHNYTNRMKSFFDHLQVSLLFVDIREYNNNTILSYKKMNPNLIDIKDSKEYIEKLGENTLYNIHPEEVSAKHFEFLITNTWKNKKNPKLIKQLQKLLQ